MNNQLWAPKTWELFHVLIEKSKEESIPYIKSILIHIITIICKSLPCPTCRKHASNLLEGYKHYNLLTSKSHFRWWIWDFHNIVNNKLNKPVFSYEDINKYNTYNLNNTFIEWNKHFKIQNHDLQVFTDKQLILNTKNMVRNLLTCHQKHFT